MTSQALKFQAYCRPPRTVLNMSKSCALHLPRLFALCRKSNRPRPRFRRARRRLSPSSRISRSPHVTMSSTFSSSRRLAWRIRKTTSLVHTLGALPGPRAGSFPSQFTYLILMRRSTSPSAQSVWYPMELPRHQLILPVFSKHQPYLLLRSRMFRRLLLMQGSNTFVPLPLCLPPVIRFVSS